MNKNKSIIGNIFHKNGRALGSMGYFVLLMLVFLIGAPEAWMRPNLHQSVFVMLPTLIFLFITLLVELSVIIILFSQQFKKFFYSLLLIFV